MPFLFFQRVKTQQIRRVCLAGHLFQKFFIHPASDPPPALVRRAAMFDWTDQTFAGRVITNLPVLLKALIAISEFLSSWTAIAILRFVIDKILFREQAALPIH